MRRVRWVELFTRRDCGAADREGREGAAVAALYWSILGRVLAGCVVIVVLMSGVTAYALLQLRQAAALSTELVTYRYAAIEAAKWLLTSLYGQLMSEKKYLAIRHPGFLMDFDEEAEEFRRTLSVLKTQDRSAEGQKLLTETERLYRDYRDLFRTRADRAGGIGAKAAAAYERRRDELVAHITTSLQAYLGLHEGRISAGVSEARAQSARAETTARVLVALAILCCLVVAGVVSHSVVRCLRRGPGADGRAGQDAVTGEAANRGRSRSVNHAG